MSVGKTCDDGTIAIFTQSGVTVHKDTDVLITCQGEPLLIGARDAKDGTASHSPNTKDGGNRGAPPRKQDKHSDTPTAYTTSHPPNKPSDGCMRCVDTPSSPPGSRPPRPATSSGGHCSPPATCRNTSQRQWRLPKGTSTNAARTPGPPNRNQFLSKPSSLPNSSAANYATYTLTPTIHVTPFSQTKQDNSLTAPHQATITSWSWSTSTRALSSPSPLRIELTSNSPAPTQHSSPGFIEQALFPANTPLTMKSPLP
eukprot:CCRYP_017210-RA/>CCRYP_017210-RA protein AED:0.40 eAED:0.40 QI:0/-1/0/1/-1/0/1/0/255